MTRLQQAQVQGPIVRINGPVKNPVVPWTEGLTLLKAIMAAEYLPSANPAQIVLVRGGVGRRLDVTGLLNGVDVPLQPGDVVQIILAGQAPAMPGQNR